jgi:cyclophilin family peptidyl-prolyl cis-trans isomerase
MQRQFWMCVGLAISCVWGQLAPVAAQEEKKEAAPATKPAEKTAAPVEKAADPEKKSEAPAAAAKSDSAEKKISAEKKEFDASLEQWKAMILELRKTRESYMAAESDDAKQKAESQWKKLIENGNALLAKMQVLGMKEFTENKSNDPQLHRFLIKVAQDAVNTDDFERGANIALSMLQRFEAEGAPPPKELYNAAGVCAFLLNDYENATKYLNLTKESGAMKDGAKNGAGTPLAEQFLGQLKTYTEYWTKEQEIREKEKATDDLPRVKFTTTAGDMVMELYENEAPETVGNFVSLIEAGFYNGLVFHRVLGGFMAQGGCPKGNGTGDAGYKIYCEAEKPEHRRHFRGTLSMAHAGKDTGCSQFFICFTPQEGLDGKHTAFGRVIEGFDTLAKIQRIDPSEKNAEVTPTKILKAEVLRKRDHKYLPRKVE